MWTYWVAEDAELVSPCLETQADTTLHVCKCFRWHGRRDCRNFVDKISFQVINSEKSGGVTS
jgi:hypothetical protein